METGQCMATGSVKKISMGEILNSNRGRVVKIRKIIHIKLAVKWQKIANYDDLCPSQRYSTWYKSQGFSPMSIVFMSMVNFISIGFRVQFHDYLQ